MKLYIAADHNGVEYKNVLIEYLKENGIETTEIGLDNYELDDYTDYAFKLGTLVSQTPESIGILICGNGVGMSIAANKVKGIRAVRAVNTDDAFKGKHHNGANVLCLGVDVDINTTKNIVDMFLTTKAASIERYVRRIDKIINYENGEYNEL